jgi:excisionase family DNA binding protein
MLFASPGRSPAVMNIQEAAEVARLERRLVSQAVHRGELPALIAGRCVRICRSELEGWLRGATSGGRRGKGAGT